MKRIFILLIMLCSCFVSFAQSSKGNEKQRIDVFVYKDSSVNTPVNALRAEFTHALKTNDSYVVLDRTDEILAFLRGELKYGELGMVRADQLIEIGQHFGATTLCVVSVTPYGEYNQYYFEGTIVDMTSRSIVKHSRYPQGNEKIQDLSPQTQMTVARELLLELGLLPEKEKALFKHQANMAIRKEHNALYGNWNSWGFTFGGGGNGVQADVLFNVSFIHLGVGITTNGNKKYFPAKFGVERSDGSQFEYEDKYYVSNLGIHFSAGVYYKYVGLAIRPELFFLAGGEKNSAIVQNKLPHTLVGFTPTVYINVPFKDIATFRSGKQTGIEEKTVVGLIGSVGYSFFPKIKHNSGLQFGLGLGFFW